MSRATTKINKSESENLGGLLLCQVYKFSKLQGLQ
jgi:hypothetical protein